MWYTYKPEINDQWRRTPQCNVNTRMTSSVSVDSFGEDSLGSIDEQLTVSERRIKEVSLKLSIYSNFNAEDRLSCDLK